MDSHLFRLFSENASAFLKGGLIEKIQEPAPGMLTFSIYNTGIKRQFVFQSGKQNPFCFFTSARLSANAHPSAQVMRIRKFFGQKRIAALIFQYWQRKIWLMAGGQAQEDGKNPWLCLDFRRGADLYFLGNEEIPEMDEAFWPDSAGLSDALDNWRDWPVLTPALRKTLALLDRSEQLALLFDLEAGGGNVFLYRKRDDGSVKRISPWPLDKKFIGNLEESVCEDVPGCLEKAGQDLVLASAFQRQDAAFAERLKKKIRQHERLLANLERDESRLNNMIAEARQAEKIQCHLWKLDKNAHVESLRLDNEEISLDRRFSIADNMARLFKAAGRGRRGLKILLERRAMLEKELNKLKSSDSGKEMKGNESATTDSMSDGRVRMPIVSTLPKNVAAFRSSDGFVLLRGKDGKGNLAIRRMAAPHDIWVHVEKGQGAHVIIRRSHPGQNIPERTLDEAGSLAANKSWLCNMDQAAVMYAELRHVKPVRKGVSGQVSIDRLAFTRLVAVRKEFETELSEK